MRISDWSLDVCSSDLDRERGCRCAEHQHDAAEPVRRHVHEARHRQEMQADHERDRRHPVDLLRWRREQRDRDVQQHDLEHEVDPERSEEHTSELQSLMRISYAVFCLKNKIIKQKNKYITNKTKINR